MQVQAANPSIAAAKAAGYGHSASQTRVTALYGTPNPPYEARVLPKTKRARSSRARQVFPVRRKTQSKRPAAWASMV